MINIYMQPRWRDIQTTFAASTQGDWYVDSDGITVMCRTKQGRVPVANMLIAGPDQRFIVMAHNEMPYVLATLIECEKALQEAQTEIVRLNKLLNESRD